MPAVDYSAIRNLHFASDAKSEEGSAMNTESLPLILHVDVNKTLIISDSVTHKSVDYTIREVTADQFWGTVEVDDEDASSSVWKWNGNCNPSVDRPVGDPKSVNYLKYCRSQIRDNQAYRLASRSMELVRDPECKAQMTRIAETAVEKMTIPAELRTKELADETGITGESRFIFPSFFHFIAYLQRSGRQFSLLFRSFSIDLGRVCAEWNAFCERRHPLYNYLLEGVGSMDGTVPGVPDRRLHEADIHTMHRDARGPVLALSACTNGNFEGEWDQWSLSKHENDTREGRAFFEEEGLDVVDGDVAIQSWLLEHLAESRTGAIRDDWAWWHHNHEKAEAGKLMLGLVGVQQVFFDDNIDKGDLRIVDPRFAESCEPVPKETCIGTACFRADTLQAAIDEMYFINAFESIGPGCSSLWGNTKFPDLKSFSAYLRSEMRSRVKQGDARVRRKSVRGSTISLIKKEALPVESEEHLSELLEEAGVDVDLFGAPGTTYKSLKNLFAEICEGKCCLKRAEEPPAEAPDINILREMEVVKVRLMSNNRLLCETHEQLPDGRLRSRNGFLPATKKRFGEPLDKAVTRWSVEELQLTLHDDHRRQAQESCIQTYQVTVETMSFPIPCATTYHEVTIVLNTETMEQKFLDKLGLPGGCMFSTQGFKKKKKKEGSLRFWNWYHVEVFEAMSSGLNQQLEVPDVAITMDKVLGSHPNRGAYKSLLLQMFDCFSASKLVGGLSGSLVLQVQPVDPFQGRNEEACIVKLDRADVVSREIKNSKRVANVLSDRAAQIMGDWCFAVDPATATEYGAFKIELAGGCWQVPELAQSGGSKELLRTFKDLLGVESMRQLLDTEMHHLFQMHGDTEIVLRELLGPGGMLRVLRREGLSRSTRNLFHSFFYSGKDTKWNPLFVPNHCQLLPMQAVWERSFGRDTQSSLPDVRKKVLELVSHFDALDDTELGRYKPIVGLAHGDLNAMNVLIDVMDAVWLIDFAFSEEKPLCWDLAKLEISFMFEYAVLPVHWMTLLSFAGDTAEDWTSRKVSSWLGVGEKTALALLVQLRRLRDGQFQGTEPGHAAPSRGLPKRRCHESLDRSGDMPLALAIRRAVDEVFEEPLDRACRKKRDTELCRLCAILLANEEEEIEALSFAATLTDIMLSGNSLTVVMDPRTPDAHGAASQSLAFCWSKASRLRQFFQDEWFTLQVRFESTCGDLVQADESPLVFWLGLLQESYRLLGYFDVAPWTKVWAINYIERLTSNIQEEITRIVSCAQTPWSAQEVCPADMEAVSTVHYPPRPYPSSLVMAHRALAMVGGAPPALATRSRIRLLHSNSPILKVLGGLFAEIRARATVAELDGNVMEVELVIEPSLPIGLTPLLLDTVEIGVIDIRLNRAYVHLNAPLVPLCRDALLNRSCWRTGICAEGRLPQGIVTVKFSVMEAAFCYPPGTRVRLATNTFGPLSGLKLRCATVVHLEETTGKYTIRWDNEVQSEFDAPEADFVEGNHVADEVVSYSKGERIICMDNSTTVDAVVVRSMAEETGEADKSGQHRLCKLKDPTEEWDMDLNPFNHVTCGPLLHTASRDEEIRRYRAFVKAKHAFLWTVTSDRSDVLQGPVPRLVDDVGRQLFFWSDIQALVSEDMFSPGWLVVGQPGSGKSCLLCKLVMHCLTLSTVLLPVLIPVIDLCARLQKLEGADQQSESGEASKQLGRLSSSHEEDGEGLICWYLAMVFGDDTLRYAVLRQNLQCHRLLLLFDGLDEAGSLLPRVERCITGLAAQDHRIVVTATRRAEDVSIESTRRPSSVGGLTPSWLKTQPELFRVTELLPLERDCRRSLAEALLSGEQQINHEDISTAADFCEEFISTLPGDEWIQWSTPMMMSILIASWRTQMLHEKQGKDLQLDRGARTSFAAGRRQSLVLEVPDAQPKEESDQNGAAKPGSENGSRPSRWKSAVNMIGLVRSVESAKRLQLDTVTKSVYGVALDLLLRRFQSRQQADRHKMKATVQIFKELLELVAAVLDARGDSHFTEADVVPLLSLFKIDEQVWKDLSLAIQENRIPLLHARKNGKEVSFQFIYGSFQRFLGRRGKPRLKGMSLIPISPVPSKSPRSRAGSTVDGERGSRLSTVSIAGESNLEEFAACKNILEDLVKNGGESREPLSKVLAAYEKMFSLLDTEAAMPRFSEAAIPRLTVSSPKATMPQELLPISADAAHPSGAASPQSALQEPSSPSARFTKPERKVPRQAESKELSPNSGDGSAKPVARSRKVVRQIDMKEVFSPPVPSVACREPPLDAQRASANSRNTPSPRESTVPDAHRGVCASRIVDVVDASACRRPVRGDRAQRGSEVSPHRLSRGKACPTSPLVSRNNVSLTASSRARQPVVVLPVSALAETSLRMSRSTPTANAHRVLSPEHQRSVYGSGEVFRPPTNKVSLPVREGVLSASSPSPSNAMTTSVGGLETTGRSAEQAKAAEVQNARHRARSETTALRRGVQPVRSHGASGLKTPSKSVSQQLGMMTLGVSPTSFPRQTGSEFP